MNLLSSVRYLAILRDTLGVDGLSHFNRNLFTAHRGTSEYLDCCRLEDHGYLRTLSQGKEPDSFHFAATKTGKAAIESLETLVGKDWASRPERLAKERFRLDGTSLSPSGAELPDVYGDGEAELRTPEELQEQPF